MRFGLPDGTIDLIVGVLRRHPPVERAVLFGSRAQGTFRPGSDIDLTLVGAGLTHRTLLHIMDERGDAPIPYRVDLSLFDQMRDPDVREHIERWGITFYSRTV
ncbi:MAG: nucleotidyltransferase domain-containing protein [Thermaerobacter sp.]|nr:nucleotidyltransferase domain-containing protein [Thermaerobacter sp.]